MEADNVITAKIISPTIKIEPECDKEAEAPKKRSDAIKAEEAKSENVCTANDSVEKNVKSFENDVKDLDSELASFMESVKDSQNAATTKRPIKHLPGFLFPDGKAQAIDPKAPLHPSSIIKFGSGMEEAERLTCKVHTSSFEVLGVTMDSSDEDIKKAFKRLSLLVHPDKCRHHKAKEAFHVASRAFEDLQRPELKERYKIVIDEARKRVIREIKDANKTRIRQKESPLPYDDDTIRYAVSALCEKLVAEMMEQAEYAEKCRKANEEWERKMEEEMREEERKKEENKKKWEETRDVRVEDWRDFQDDVVTKKFKVAAFVPIAHRREQRRQGDKTAPSKPRGIDDSYKQNWR